eukprot:Lithocolla_globosa_v1_NODE_428_length_4088_cov_7.104885.p1 type:complete len:524 gc:universal NODE_428_length_4088_cov_7.104885:108-1679(+)
MEEFEVIYSHVFVNLLRDPKAFTLFQDFLKETDSKTSFSLLRIILVCERFQKSSTKSQKNATYILENYFTTILTPDEIQLKKEQAQNNNNNNGFDGFFEILVSMAIDSLFQDHYIPFLMSMMLTNTGQLNESTTGVSYKGIGDCFLISDAVLPDCPVVAMTKIFTTLTGYEPNEVIGRNCRFLQGPQSNRFQGVAAMREAISNQVPITELLLNYTKEGRPFWNLVHITPLRDKTNHIVGFLGGQIDVSENFLTSLQIKRLVKDSDGSKTEKEKTTDLPSPPRNPSSSQKKFQFLKGKNKLKSTEKDVVVEQDTPIVDLHKRAQVFKHAYSHNICVKPNKMGEIVFVSDAICKDTGYSVSELIGKPFSLFYGSQTTSSSKSILSDCFIKKIPIQQHVILKAYSSEKILQVYKVRFTPAYNGEGVVSLLIGLMIPLKEEKQQDSQPIKPQKKQLSENEPLIEMDSDVLEEGSTVNAICDVYPEEEGHLILVEGEVLVILQKMQDSLYKVQTLDGATGIVHVDNIA